MRWMLAAALALIAIHAAYGLGYLWYSLPDEREKAFSSGFEGAALEEWSEMGAQQFCCAHSLAIVGDVVRSGRAAARIELRADDDKTRGSLRAEFRLKAVPMGSVYRYAFSVFVPEDWEFDPIPVTVAQWHAVPDKILFEGGRTPPLRVAIRDGDWYVVAHWDATPVAPLMFQRERADKHALIWRGPVERGLWTDWALTVRWSHLGDGRVIVVKDGVEVADHHGPVAYNDFLAPYFKVGIYIPDWALAAKPATARRRVLYLDDVAKSEAKPADAPGRR